MDLPTPSRDKNEGVHRSKGGKGGGHDFWTTCLDLRRRENTRFRENSQQSREAEILFFLKISEVALMLRRPKVAFSGILGSAFRWVDATLYRCFCAQLLRQAKSSSPSLLLLLLLPP